MIKVTSVTIANREELRGLFDIDRLPDTKLKVTIAPISEEEADEFEFKSLKGIAGRPLDADEVRKERLGI